MPSSPHDTNEFLTSTFSHSEISIASEFWALSLDNTLILSIITLSQYVKSKLNAGGFLIVISFNNILDVDLILIKLGLKNSK